MDIRKKGAICMFIYNVIGTLAICSAYPSDPLYSDELSFIGGFTFPITIISFAFRYAASEPIYPVFIIQFIVLIASIFILDLILRNYSPAYIQKRDEKYLAEREKAFNQLITEQQVAIYLKYAKDIDGFARVGTPEDRATLSVEQWYTIDNLAHDIFLIKRKLVSASTKDSIEKRIKDKLKDQAAMDLLFSAE
ncbi:hypothetical protein CLV62_101277 [Dysgonomonas alginatilytica]|uniref:Uncharacterized protein n=1 Tax=Dysgonomonas alginatilytica TaxID=1605892 RepID=A0A2V3PTI2_9BACT|nr:hypothetical protein [Dysgonomonas alginatilytica]PXV69010.1 hypothetical protein CLV62_101277 [Dysgonomonas alginatilytica]